MRLYSGQFQTVPITLSANLGLRNTIAYLLTYLLVYLWQAKLQHDVAKWVAIHTEAMPDCAFGSVIQETFKFAEFLKRATRELTPAGHRVLEFLRQLDISGYDIASRKMDVEVSLILKQQRASVSLSLSLRRDQ